MGRIHLDCDLLRHMYVDRKMTVEAIRLHFKCSDVTVRNRLMHIGVKMRTRSESQKLRRFKNMKNDEELKKRIVYLYCEREMTLEKVSREIGTVSVGYVGRLLRIWGIPRRKCYNAKWDKLPAQDIIKKYCEGLLSCNTIAEQYGTSPMLIAKVLDMNGIKRRSLSEAKKNYWDRLKKERENHSGNSVKTETQDIPEGTVEEQIVVMRRERGVFVQDIAKSLNVSLDQVLEVLTGANLLSVSI